MLSLLQVLAAPAPAPPLPGTATCSPNPHSTRAGAHHRVLSPRVCTRQALSPLPQMDVAALRAEIKAWERDFRSKHGRDPSIQEIKDQPTIGTYPFISLAFRRVHP